MQYAREDSIMQVTHVPTSPTHVVSQGLLELLWTVNSEEELQLCLKLRNFETRFNKDKSVGL